VVIGLGLGERRQNARQCMKSWRHLVCRNAWKSSCKRRRQVALSLGVWIDITLWFYANTQETRLDGTTDAMVAGGNIDARIRNGSLSYPHDEGDATRAPTASGRGRIKGRSASTDEQTSLLGSDREDSAPVAEGSEDETDNGYWGPVRGDFSELSWWRRPSVRIYRCLGMAKTLD